MRDAVIIINNFFIKKFLFRIKRKTEKQLF